MKPKTITKEFSGIGAVQFKKNSRARNINIRIKPFTGVSVSVPRGMSFSRAESFLKQKADWITKNLQKVREYESKVKVYDGSEPLKTRFHEIEVAPANTEKVTVRTNQDHVKVSYPHAFNLSDPVIQTVIRTTLISVYRKEAKAYLPDRLAELAKRYGFCYQRVFIKNHKSRWGSCSAVNNINLNLNLMRLPDDLIDYVLLHELVHTEIKDHSPRFWARVDEVCEDVKLKRKQMREYHLF